MTGQKNGKEILVVIAEAMVMLLRVLFVQYYGLVKPNEAEKILIRYLI